MSEKMMNDPVRTGKTAGQGVLDELKKAAEAHADQHFEELLEMKRKRKKALIKLGTMSVLTVIILVFATIAWFTMSREVGTSGASAQAPDLPFDIATKGTGIRNKTIISSRTDYSSGIQGTLEDENGTSGTYYTGDSILLRYDTGEEEVGPGGSGELSLYVVPKTNEALKLKVTLDVVAFAEIQKYRLETVQPDPEDEDAQEEIVKVNDGTQVIEITSASDFATQANAVNNEEAAAAAAQYVKTVNHLRGHILFFGAEGDLTDPDENKNYYYKDPLTDRVLSITVPAGNEGKAVRIPVYWMWPNTLGQLALQTNNSLRKGIPVVQQVEVNSSEEEEPGEESEEDPVVTDKELILQYLLANKDSVFADASAITRAVIYDADTQTNFDALSLQYNTADNSIGTNIAYFMIEASVSAGS